MSQSALLIFTRLDYPERRKYNPPFENTFKNIDDILIYMIQEQDSELGITFIKTSRVLFLCAPDELEQEPLDEAALRGEPLRIYH